MRNVQGGARLELTATTRQALRIALLASTAIALCGSVCIPGAARAQTVYDSPTPVYLISPGGPGVDGDDPILGAQTYPGTGQVGGTVNIINNGAISQPGPEEAFITIHADGGRGGNAFQASSILTVTQSGATGGTGGPVTLQNNAVLANNPQTPLQGSGIGITSNGGTGGAAVASKGGDSSISGAGGVGGVILVTTGSTIIASEAAGYGISAASDGGSAGASADAGTTFENLHASASTGGTGGGGGSVTTKLVGATLTVSGDRSTGILASSNGGAGSDGGLGGTGEFQDVATAGGSGGAGGTVSVSLDAASSVTTSGVQSVGVLAQSNGGAGGNSGITRLGVFDFSAQAGSSGNGGAANVENNGSIITTNSASHGIVAQAMGGTGGATNTKVGLLVSLADAGGGGGNGGSASVTNGATGSVTVKGADAFGIIAQSVGGLGGAGGDSGSLAVSVGGAGGNAGSGGVASVTNAGTVTTTGSGGGGILALSVGGGGGVVLGSEVQSQFGGPAGGNGGSGVAILGRLSIGGNAGNGGNGGNVTVSNSGAVTSNATAISAQSIGGGGGTAGGSYDFTLFAGISIGGSGGGGGEGGTVVVQNDGGTILTKGSGAMGILASSVGGGGGDGGTSMGAALGIPTGPEDPALSFNVTIGGSAGNGGVGGAVQVTNNSAITTTDADSVGILAQSVGGGGGNGGSSTGGSVNLGGNTSLTISLAVGGSGGDGGWGNDVSLTNSAAVSTELDQSVALHAQSVGGGGGNGGNARAVTAAFSGALSASVSLTVGGTGGLGGGGSQVVVKNQGKLSTQGVFSDAILAQSIGGGGGAGGLGGSYSLSGLLPAGLSSVMDVGVGGNGGTSGSGGSVYVTNSAAIDTQNVSSRGIVAQSVGGGGGIGSGGQTTGLSTVASVTVGIGGKGGASGNGGSVTVQNEAGGTITTAADGGVGILAQSVGGGGGAGGAASAGSVLPSGASLTNVAKLFGDALKKIGDKVGTKAPKYNGSLGVNMGGSGGAAGDGGALSVTNDAMIATKGDTSTGILAQSIGGGGGLGGAASGSSGSIFNGLTIVGGQGGARGKGGAVTVTNSGTISTKGDYALGILAQSVGGGGGVGGTAGDSAVGPGQLSYVAGGNGGASGDGDSVSLTNTGRVTTTGSHAHGLAGQSVGGGGGAFFVNFQTFNADNLPIPKDDKPIYANPGTPGAASPDPDSGTGGGTGGNGASLNFTYNLGGSGNAGGDGGKVSITNSAAIETHNMDSYGIFAQSIGGGGGFGGASATNQIGTVGLTYGGNSGAAGNGGAVAITLDAGSAITTHETGSVGIMAQSIGGGGGQVGGVSGAGSLIQGGTSGGGSGGGNGGDISIATAEGATSQITTKGMGAHGIFAQTDGGGGGVVGTWAGTLSVHDVSWGSTGSSGVGGKVTIDYTGGISATGRNAVAVYAESLGADTTTSWSPQNGQISITTNGTILGGSGSTGAGIALVGGSGNALTIAGGSVSAGAGGYAIAAAGGAIGRATDSGLALAVVNNGTVTGNVDLGVGANSFTNNGIFNPGATVNINNAAGSAGWSQPNAAMASLTPSNTVPAGAASTADIFTDAGTTNVAGAGVIGATLMQTSSYVQPSAGQLQTDIDFSKKAADGLTITGSAALSGTLVPNLIALPATVPAAGLKPVVVLTAQGGLSGAPQVIDTIAANYTLVQTANTLAVQLTSLTFNNAGVTTTAAQNVANHFQALWSAGTPGAFAPAMTTLANIPKGAEAGYNKTLGQLANEGAAAPAAHAPMRSSAFANTLHSCPVFVGETALLSEQSCVWARVVGGSYTENSQGGVAGYDSTWTAYQAGGQKALDDDWFIGGAFSIGQTSMAADNSAFSSDSDDYSVGLVVKKRLADAWLLSLSANYTYNSADQSRTVLPIGGGLLVANSQSSINTYGARAQVAYYADFGRWYAKPMVDLDIAYVQVPSYSESGAGIWNLHFGSADDFQYGLSPTLEIGTRLDLPEAILRTYANAGFTYWSDGDWEQSAVFEGSPLGAPGFVNLFAGSQLFARGAVGAELVMSQGLEVRLQYDLQGNDDFFSHAFMGRLGYRF